MFREKTDTTKFFSGPIEVKKSPLHGLGVFALEDIPAHTCIEICPVILFSKDLLADWMDHVRGRHVLHDHVFRYSEGGLDENGEALGQAICLGWGSIINHSTNESNVIWRWSEDTGQPALEFWTIRKINKGDEVLSKYCPAGRECQWL